MSKTYNLDIAVQKKILVQATETQLREIKKLVTSLKDKQLVSKVAENVYKLYPKETTKKTPRLLTQMTVGDLSGKKVKNEEIPDFENSGEFYKEIPKKGVKIVFDEFSDARNTKLYEGFNLIEKRWREIIIKNLGVDFIKDAADPKSIQGGVDHKISQYMWSELLENILYQPASEEYLRGRWKASSKTEADVIEIAGLKIIDELNLHLGTQDLKFLQSTRNKCMHFRIVTVDEYSKAVDKINDYLKLEALKDFAKVFQDSMKPLIESFRKLADMSKSFQDIAQTINKSLISVSGVKKIFKK